MLDAMVIKKMFFRFHPALWPLKILSSIPCRVAAAEFRPAF
jgi:hypothetical protein